MVEKDTHKFCSNCGSELSHNAKFCSNCGNKVEIIGEKEVSSPKINSVVSKIPYYLFIGLILVFVFLLIQGLVTSIGPTLTGPSDSEIRFAIFPTWPYMWQGGPEIRSFSVNDKVRCTQLSERARASGVTRAWLIGYTFQSYNDFWDEWNHFDRVAVITEKSGTLQELNGPSQCP